MGFKYTKIGESDVSSRCIFASSKKWLVSLTLEVMVAYVLVAGAYHHRGQTFLQSLLKHTSYGVYRIDWSRFAYTQYVTNERYLCNSVMIFASLEQVGSKAERVMLYPSHLQYSLDDSSEASVLLRKARDEYRVRLKPIEVLRSWNSEPTWSDSYTYTKLLVFNQTEYDRVLQLDPDAIVRQSMDELFLLPPAPAALPRAYWEETAHDQLSDRMTLIQPSASEFARILDAIEHAANSVFNRDIVRELYPDSAPVLPHRGYALSTRELRRPDHEAYFGNGLEKWDVDAVVAAAKVIHFSDWPVPKPWDYCWEGMFEGHQPECVDGDCHQRDVWRGFHADFAARRKEVCGLGLLG